MEPISTYSGFNLFLTMNRAIKDKKIYTNEITAICSIVKPLSINNPNKAVPKAVENTINAVVNALIDPMYFTP